MIQKKRKTAGGVVLNNKGQILVVNQKGNDSWSLPKGEIEKGETALETAKREIREETGITRLKFIKELGSYKRFRIPLNRNGDDLSLLMNISMFLFSTSQKTLKLNDSEIPDARWVNKEDVANLLTHRKDKEFFLKILREI